jgi:hypothetical protein
MLAISPEKVFFIVVKAREFAAKDAVTDPDRGSIGLTRRGTQSRRKRSRAPVWRLRPCGGAVRIDA